MKTEIKVSKSKYELGVARTRQYVEYVEDVKSFFDAAEKDARAEERRGFGKVTIERNEKSLYINYLALLSSLKIDEMFIIEDTIVNNH